ncbi:pilus assembly protein TadG-related protein [Anaerovibrio lipolyticus]|uniref:pilus assembly protein TadG-related protein n=1 Tax=Anaerovibrio lipolyticus TaxID=82374 RepID=UPI0025DAF4C8|nr:pilus assembly protein TadG-related protein [Anaerovibrio lipolyticus]
MIKEQRGAVIILFAVLIPFLMCFAGLVVDFGNLYAHYSRLQNAADAAALAGGNAFAESGGNLDTANEFAQGYVITNDQRASFKSPPTIQEKNNKFYYVVVLKERVSLYFLRYFPRIGADTEISATSCARISVQGNNSGDNGGGFFLFDNLFTAKQGFDSVNSIQNPDNHNIPQNQNSCSTYHGNIVIGDEGAFNEASRNVYLQPEAFGTDGNSQITVNEAINQGYVNIPEYSGNLEVTEYYRDTVQQLMAADSTYKITDQNKQNVDSEFLNQLSTQGVDVIYYNIPNLNFNLTQAINGKTDDPLYIICDNINNFNTSADMTGGRPIVLIYNGAGNFWMNCNGGTFTGDIYAPFGSVNINDNHHLFYGSIVAGNRIQLQSQGYYIQRNYTSTGTGGSGSGSGTGAGSVSYRVTLVNASQAL